MKELPCTPDGETVETVLLISQGHLITGLKPGVNERKDTQTFEARQVSNKLWKLNPKSEFRIPKSTVRS